MIEIIPESIQLLKISDETYFGPEYRDYISNSKLKLINPSEGGSIDLWEQGIKSKSSTSFELGSAIHAILLQPESFYINSIRKPSGKLGVFAEKVISLKSQYTDINKVYKIASIESDYYVNKLTENRLNKAISECTYFWNHYNDDIIPDKTTIYLSENMYDKYDQCMFGISENSRLLRLLENSQNEMAIICDILVNGVLLKFKAKLDSFILDLDNNLVILNDLKTTGHQVNYFMGNNANILDENGDYITKWIDGSFQKYHYYRQMAFYLFLLQAYLFKTYGQIFDYKANMLVVETVPEFKSRVFSVSDKQLRDGLDELKELLIMVAEWKKTK